MSDREPVAVWLDGALYSVSGPDERKSKNLAHNPTASSRPGAAVVYRLTPVKAFGFGKGESFSQTRWSF